MKKEENYNNKASAKKWDKLIKESDDEYLIENIKKQKNKNVVFGSASLFTSFNISNNNTINKINNIINNSNNSTVSVAIIIALRISIIRVIVVRGDPDILQSFQL